MIKKNILNCKVNPNKQDQVKLGRRLWSFPFSPHRGIISRTLANVAPTERNLFRYLANNEEAEIKLFLTKQASIYFMQLYGTVSFV